jgi:hypothetical protein
LIRPLPAVILAATAVLVCVPRPACGDRDARAAALDPAGAARLATARLVEGEQAPPVVTSDPASGAIVAMRGATVPLARGREEPAAAACAWVAAHAAAFGLAAGADEVRVERLEALAGAGHRILLQQYWNDIPVESADARCIVDATGALRYVASGFLVGLDAPRRPRVSRAAAIAAAANASGASLLRATASARLWVRRRADGDRLAWGVRLALANESVPTIWVDAVGGDLLAIDSGCANAVGLAYPTDPRGPLVEVPLERLLPGSGLVSHEAGIADVLEPPVTPRGPDGDYRYPPSDPLFDQVNVYWHTDHYLHDFLGGLGYAGPPESLVVRVNVSLEPFVAQTTQQFVHLGRPIAGFVQDVARADDIIYHELTHAVIYGFGIQPTGARGEAGAFHEGLADYFAAALTGDPAIGEWLYLTYPTGVTRVDQPVDPWNYAHYGRVAYGGGDAGTVYGNGMILSSTLWDLRGAIGSAADSLVLESLTYLPSAPIWSQFANALLQADQDHHAGRFAGAIAGALLRRGIRGIATADFRGPRTLAPGVEGEFDAEPCCGGTFGADRWRVRSMCRGIPCSEWRDVGEGPTLRLAFKDDSELELTVHTPWNDTLTAAHFVDVHPPELIVEGPERVAQRSRATWIAHITATGPASVTWERTWHRFGEHAQTVGEGLTCSLFADTAMDLDVTLVDGLGRTAARHLVVATFVDHPPPLGPTAFRMSQQLDARARRAETTIELPHATPLELTVYDVRGRLRATLWGGPAERGTHVVRWDASGLEPGVYFLRLVARPTGILERFVVVR